MILTAPSYTSGASQEIKEIFQIQQQVDAKMKESDSLSEGFLSALQRLERLKESASVSGWDGEEAEAVNEKSYENAKWFLFSAPVGIIAPDPGIDVNGQMTLEWRQKDGRLLSLTFDNQDNVHYIYFQNADKIYGVRPISKGYSEKLSELLEDVIRK